MTELHCDAYVDGAWVRGPRRFAVTDPFDGALVAEVTDADEAMADAAVAAAARAFPVWRRRPAPERGRLLGQLAARMIADEQR
ncbi:MAG TPA: aldehyde dehydrogenase family protein, partial [Kofleriaceae bacterium]|nr:aldehyde dehydrogenase family protein [Kofleriaceae bacterium]